MLSKLKPSFRPMLEVPAHGLIRMGLTPNMVTLVGMMLSLAFCAALAWTGSVLLFIPLLTLCFLFDALDGAVARLTGQRTHTGGYLDALCDRATDGALCIALAEVTGRWQLYFAIALGAGLFSYAKARAEMEASVGNDAWPDLMERTERCVLLLASAFLHGLFPGVILAGVGLLDWWLLCIAILIYWSLGQRVLRAIRLLVAVDRAAGAPMGQNRENSFDPLCGDLCPSQVAAHEPQARKHRR